jgi:hypothetical protein
MARVWTLPTKCHERPLIGPAAPPIRTLEASPVAVRGAILPTRSRVDFADQGVDSADHHRRPVNDLGSLSRGLCRPNK